MASQNDPHQLPQTQTPHQDDNGDSDNKSGGQDSSTTTTACFGGRAGHAEGEGSSLHNPASMSADGVSGSGFFTLDGMKFDIRDFDSKDNDHGAFNVQDFYHDGVFSCEDLYAVVNSSNPTLAVTEVENASDWHSGSNIPVSTSDLKQLGHGGSGSQTGTATAVVTGVTKVNGPGSTTALGVGGMKIPASGGYPSNGSFYRLVTLTNSLDNVGAASMAYSGHDISTSPSATESNGVTSTPSENTAGNSGVENSQSPEVMASPVAGTKARKPRGRKPKHVKEAEAAAAAAAVAASATPSSAETATSSPKGTVVRNINFRDRYENQGDMVLKSNIPHQSTFPYSTSTQQHTITTPQAPPNSPYLPQQQVPLHTSSGLGSAVAAKMHGTQWSQSQPQMSLEQLASHDRRAILLSMRNQGMSVTNKSHHHHYPYPQQQQQASHNTQLAPPPTSGTHRAHPPCQHRPMYSEQSAPPSPYERPIQCSARTYQHRAKDPLDQLFANRIAAPSNRSTVKPNIIQENRSIYNLLTTPTTKMYAPSSLEQLKLSQERWMQYPNPSILNENLTAPSSIQHAASNSGISHSHHCPSYPPPPPPRVDPSTLILGSGENVNICQGSDFNSAARHPQYPHSHEYDSGYHHRFTNQVQEMNVRLERLANGNYELRRQLQYLVKVNRHLMNRLRLEIKDNLELRDSKYQQRLELHGDCEFASNGRRGRGLREGETLSSYLEDEFMCTEGNGLGGKRCMRYEDNDEFLPVSGSVLANPSWPLRGTSGEHCSYRHRAPHFHRSSLLMREHGPLEREFRGEGCYGDGGKRKMDDSCSSSQYGNLSKRIRPDTLDMTVGNDEGKVIEGELGLGDDGKNSRNLESGTHNVASQPSAQITEEVDIPRVKMELSSPTRTNSSLGSVKSVATELATPTPTDDSENTSSTVFNSPSKPGNFVHSTGPYFQACDFESFHGLKGLGDSVVVQSNKTTVSSAGNYEKSRDKEYTATV